jgi:signal transduction histidine kinase
MLLKSQHTYSSQQARARSAFKTVTQQLSPEGIHPSDLLSALPWQAAILDQDGVIRAVNEAWRRFAAEDDAPSLPEFGIGLNYFDVGRWSFGLHDETVRQACEGIREVLAGRQSLFTLEYAYPLPTRQRWFQLTVTPLANGHPGALIQRLDMVAQAQIVMAETSPASRAVSGADPQTQRPFEGLLALAHTLVIPATQEDAAGVSAVAHTLSELALAMFGCEQLSILVLDAETEAPQPIAVASRQPYIEWAWQRRHERMASPENRFPPSLISRLHSDEIIATDAGSVSEYIGEHAPASWLIAPIRSAGRLLGMLRLEYGVRPHHFTEEELTLARAVARMAVLVLEQRQLQNERDQAVRERAEATTRELATREASRQMELFIAMAGHEFRTPLTVIKGQLYLAERKLGAIAPQGELTAAVASASARESLDAAQRAASRLGSLLDDLLEVTNAQAGRLTMHPEWCDLVALVRDQVADQRQLHPSRRLDLHLSGQRHVYILADPVRLAEVFTNYLNNACKYSPDSTPIRVEIGVEDDMASVSVRDQGPGLSPSAQTHIWERFYQAPGIKPQSGGDAGLGLGLYICRMIVEQHGGEVGVDSAVGKGATFWCRVPLRMRAP